MRRYSILFFSAPATTEIYTLSLHDALPISGGDVHAGRDDEGRGEQLELQVVRQLQLPSHALLAQVLRDQRRVLDRGADLVRDGGDELAVPRGERVRAHAVGQVDDADRLGALA